MKKLLLITIGLLSLAAQAQFSAGTQRMLKYWYYRDRMNTKFSIGNGLGDGMSIPANQRTNNGELLYGDGTINLAYYICVLATEYKMLSDQGLPTNNTLEELTYAVKALRRLDSNADRFWGAAYTSNYNGFFIRDDVGRSFLSANNTFLDPNDADYINAINFSNTNNRHWKTVSSISSDWTQSFGPPRNYALAESKDQIIHIIMACRTVIECMNGATYQGYDFTNEVKDIYKLMLNYIHQPWASPQIQEWTIFDPQHTKVNRGWNLWSLCPGFSKCYRKITGNRNPNLISIASHNSDWALAQAVFLAASKYHKIYNSREGLKLLNLVVASDAYYSNNAAKIMTYSHLYPKYESIHIPLFNQLLNGVNDLMPASYYTNYLDEAPCYGPYNYDNGNYPSYNWSSTNLLTDPDRRGESGQWYAGDYTGIDYLLLYNLYYLTKANSGFSNLYNKNTITDYPYTYGNTTIGNVAIPAYIIEANRIEAANTIHSNGKATYRAGNEIVLNSGFQVENGGDFLAYISPLECLGGTELYKQAAPISSLKAEDKIIPSNLSESKLNDVSVFPIPFSDNLNFKITLLGESRLQITIKDVIGQIIETVFDGSASEGYHFISHSLEKYPFGVYLCSVNINGVNKTFKTIKSIQN